MTSTITDPRWRVDIGIGLDPSDEWRHEWTIYQGDRSTVADDVYVLGGLTFGWAITTAYWPAQPGPQTCSLTLNVPDFSDMFDLVEGDQVYVRVRPYAAELAPGVDPIEVDGPIVAEFYGRTADLTAQPRSGRHGVTIALTAVDYTADLTEGLNVDLKTLNPFVEVVPRIPETNLANILWTNLGGTPNTIDDLWTSADHEAAKSAIPDDVSSALEALLLSAFVEETHTHTRMIVAPRVDDEGRLVDPAVGRMFTLDTISVPRPDDIADMEFSAKWIEKDVEWNQNKAQRPGTAIVTATIGETEEENLTATIATTVLEGAPSVSLTSVEVTGWDNDRYVDMAAFYLGDPASDDTWQVESVVLRPELVRDVDGTVDDDALHQLGADLYGLFPHWGLAEASAARASCYTKRVSIVDAEPTWLPYPGLVLSTNGIVTGAAVKISGRQLSFDLALRRMRHVSIFG